MGGDNLIIFNELEYSKRLLQEGYIRKHKPKKDLFVLCKFYKDRGFGQLQATKELFKFINKYNTYVYDELIDKLKRHVLNRIRQVYKYNYTFRIGLNIPMSKIELIEIQKQKTNGEKQVLFMMVVLSKFFINKNGIFYVTIKDIFELTGLFYNKEHARCILIKLIKNKYIFIINKPNMYRYFINQIAYKIQKIYYKINIPKCEDIAYVVNNEKNIIEEFAKCMNIVDNKFKYCIFCGSEFEKKSNRHKMCKKCWKERQLELWRENKRKHRNVQV